MKITYRKLQAEDSFRYRKIRLESLKTHPKSFDSTYEEQRKMPKLMFEKVLEQPVDDRFVVGAFDQNKLIGICGFVPSGLAESLNIDNAGTIIQMYVKPTYSGRKIGLNLVNTTIREVFERSEYQQVVLGVKEDNKRAIRVYEQAGFQTYNSEPSKTDYRIMIFPRDN